MKMMMRLKRLELKVEYDEHQMDVFHTDMQPNPDPPTIVVIDGKEYEGTVVFIQRDNGYDIMIKLEREA